MGRLAITLILAAALNGCAVLNTLHTEVSTYGQWPVGRAPGSYAFERLPSQQASAKAQDAQDALESAARPALREAGFTEAPDGQEPEVRVQVAARLTRVDTSAWDPPFSFGGQWAWGRSSWWGLGWQVAPPRREREVGLVVRDHATGRVLYEARAGHEGSAVGDSRLLAAMFSAALRDFPNSGVNPRVVRVPLEPSQR
jgi:hypothetical protein